MSTVHIIFIKDNPNCAFNIKKNAEQYADELRKKYSEVSVRAVPISDRDTNYDDNNYYCVYESRWDF